MDYTKLLQDKVRQASERMAEACSNFIFALCASCRRRRCGMAQVDHIMPGGGCKACSCQGYRMRKQDTGKGG
jgi:hypothetical protein